MTSRFGISERQTILKRHVYLFLAEEMPDCAVGLHPRKRFPSSRRSEASIQMHLALQVAKAADNITPPRSLCGIQNQPIQFFTTQVISKSPNKRSQLSLRVLHERKLLFGVPHRSIILLFATNQASTLLGRNPGNWLLSA